MADPVVSYPVDYTGQAASNKIPGEQIIILPPGDRLFHYTMPRFAPFFEEGLVVKIRDTNNNVIPLVKGVDYYLGHKFMDASLATMHPLFGSIQFLRLDIVGTLIVDYQTLGGIWTISADQITEILMNTVNNPRITSWEQVVERPVDFPVVDHPWDLDDMVGQKEILEVLQNFYNAYLASLDPNGAGGGSGVIAEHINNRNNPHQVTAAQTGAYTTAQVDQKLGLYLLATAQAADSLKLAGKTYAQLMTDVVNTKVANATHADSADNATNATTASNAVNFNGKSYVQVMTDVAGVKVANAAHADNADHATDADTATNSTQFGGKSLATVMADVKATKVDNATHADNADNATTATTATNSTQLGGKTLAQVMLDVAASTVDNATKFNGKTYAQATADILSGKAADSDKLAGKTLQEIINQLQQSTGDASTLSGKTLAQIMADVKATKVDNATQADNATNSTQLGGQTLAQVLASVANTIPNTAHDAEKVYGLDINQLTTTILDSDTYLNHLSYAADLIDVQGITITNPGTGGTADPSYAYALLGQFPIPLTGTNGDKYDPSVKRYGSTMNLMFFFLGKVYCLRVNVDITDSQVMTLNFTSDVDISADVKIGIRNVNSTITDVGGTQTAKFAEMYIAYKTNANLRKIGVFQSIKGSFALQGQDNIVFTNQTSGPLNVVAWQNDTKQFQVQTLETSTQAGFDAMTTAITTLIATPAA